MRKKDFVAIVMAAIVILGVGGGVFGLLQAHLVPLD